MSLNCDIFQLIIALMVNDGLPQNLIPSSMFTSECDQMLVIRISEDEDEVLHSEEFPFALFISISSEHPPIMKPSPVA